MLSFYNEGPGEIRGFLFGNMISHKIVQNKTT